MINFKSRPTVLAVLLGVFSLISLGLFINKISLERQNRHWTEHSHFLEKILRRSRKQHKTLFRSVKNRQKQAENLNSALKSLKKDNESLEDLLEKTRPISPRCRRKKFIWKKC